MRYGIGLSALAESTVRVPVIGKSSLRPGDRVILKTLNSVYSLLVLHDGSCAVSGGWFDRKGRSPMKLRVNGCTWGGSAIRPDIVAAPGLCVEFSNRLVTTPVRSAFVLPLGFENTLAAENMQGGGRRT